MNYPAPDPQPQGLVDGGQLVTIETDEPSPVPKPGETSACAAIGRLHKWKRRGSQPLMGLDKDNLTAPPKFSGQRVTQWRCHRCGRETYQRRNADA